LLTYSVNDGTVPSYFLFNCPDRTTSSGSSGQAEGVATVDNLFRQDSAVLGGAVGGANAVFFDALGRTYASGCAWRSNKNPSAISRPREGRIAQNGCGLFA